MTLKLNDPVSIVKGIGAERARLLKSVGIESVADAINYWPRKYDDYSKVSPINKCKPGKVTIKAQITNVSHRYIRRGLHITRALATDDTDSMQLIWFNQPYRFKSIKSKTYYYISGEYDVYNGFLSVSNPSLLEYNEEADKSLIQPIYPETKNLKSHILRQLIKNIYFNEPTLPETLPEIITKKYSLLNRAEAVRTLHLPKTSEDLEEAKKRIAFEELFQMQLASKLLRINIDKIKAPKIHFDLGVIKNALKHITFQLTEDQRRVLWQIYKDMAESTSMNRLVEGDVGSGKTAVATLASLMVIKSNYQVIFMAPTEILAKQHYKNIVNLFNSIDKKIKVGLLVGSMSNKEKLKLRGMLKNREISLVVGTHALIQEKTVIENAGLVIVDEQHRFGVNQRQKLKHSDGTYPHFLSMTATPIPRSLALTLYGELDLSIIKSMPEGRKPIYTEIINNAMRHDFYSKLDKEISNGQRVFVVCPLIEKSEYLSVSDATSIHHELSTKFLKLRRIGLLHGRMKSDEKDLIMNKFKNGDLDVLVSTTVIEVGVDIPEANVMVIESAERFGLAQIHQLRGRVGRGQEKGFCYLIPSPEVGETRRLRAVADNTDGFKLAELDLEIRGPGAIYGTRQTGVLDLRMARFDDRKMIMMAKEAAECFIREKIDMLKYAELNARIKHFQSLTNLN